MANHQELIDMGFTLDQIQWSLQKSELNNKSPLENLLEASSSGSLSNTMPEKDLTPEIILRSNNEEIGLKNFSNVCYLNALIQIYFSIPGFVNEILNYEISPSFKDDTKNMEAKQRNRYDKSCIFVYQLKLLFCKLILSNEQSIDPSEMAKSILDDEGNNVTTQGEERDVSEFNLIFLARLDDAFTIKDHHEKKSSLLDDEDYDSALSLTDMIKCMKKVNLKANSFIMKNFIGSMDEYFQYNENGVSKSNKISIIFGPIILGIQEGNLMSSFENYMHSKLEGYKTESGQIVTAKKDFYITRSPEILFFQLQRVVYDPKKGLYKANDTFRFDKEIYIDSYMEKNKSKMNEKSSQINSIKSEISKIENEILGIKHFSSSGINLENALEVVSMFLNTPHLLKKQEENSSENLLGSQINDGNGFEDFEFISSNINDFKTNLGPKMAEIHLEIKNRLKSLENKKLELEKSLDLIYSDMKNEKYCLAGILIHQGKADSGHYYAYRYNFHTKSWSKYNDSKISNVENEKDMFDEAFGYDNTSAYCLVYIKSTSLQEYKQIKDINLLGYFEIIQNSKKTPFPKIMQIMQIFIKLNDETLKQYEITNAKNMAERAIEIYKDKIGLMNQLLRNYSTFLSNYPSIQIIPTSNFLVFARKCSANMNKVIQLIALQSAIYTTSKGELRLEKLESNKIMKLKLIFDSMHQLDERKIVDITNFDSELRKIYDISHKFKEFLYRNKLINLIFKSFMSKDFFSNLKYISYWGLKKMENITNDSLSYFVQKILMFSILKGAEQFDTIIMNNSPFDAEILPYFRMLYNCCLLFKAEQFRENGIILDLLTDIIKKCSLSEKEKTVLINNFQTLTKIYENKRINQNSEDYALTLKRNEIDEIEKEIGLSQFDIWIWKNEDKDKFLEELIKMMVDIQKDQKVYFEFLEFIVKQKEGIKVSLEKFKKNGKSYF